MEFLLGLLFWAVFFACLYFAYRIGQKTKPAKQQEVDPELKRKAKEMHTNFQSLMNYDVSQALERKKVT